MKDRIQTILCAVDFSGISAHALAFARLMARCTRAKTIAAYANWFEAPVYFTSGQMAAMKAEFEQAATAAQEALAGFVESGAGGGPVELRVVDALPVEGILRLIGETGADMVAMGTHGRQGVQKWVLGSVAERVIRESPVPVLTVRSAAPQAVRQVLCPVDGSQVSRRALGLAAELSAACGAQLTVLHVREGTEAGEGLCARMAEGVGARCTIREMERSGNAAEEIGKAAREQGADLVVLGAPRRRFFEGMVMGSTTVRTVRHAPCPVVTVP